ncbi:MAG: transcription antitermination protein nusG [Rhizobium sp.]|nr:transcription antitermination protein nusG [Rhizobium sp.]
MSELLELKIGDFAGFVDRPVAAATPQDGDSSKRRWAVCQTFSNQVHRVRPEIEKANRGTFIPTYARFWGKGGLPWSTERPLLPGYLFFQTEPDAWGEVKNIDGVCAVITNAGHASPVGDAEMHRLVLDHAMGVHNQFEGGVPAQKRQSRRRRRPRPGRRTREKLRASA